MSIEAKFIFSRDNPSELPGDVQLQQIMQRVCRSLYPSQQKTDEMKISTIDRSVSKSPSSPNSKKKVTATDRSVSKSPSSPTSLLPTPPSLKNVWSDFFLSPECALIQKDAFWLVYCENFQPSADKSSFAMDRMLLRMSGNYAIILRSLAGRRIKPPSMLDDVLDRYANGLSLVLYISFIIAFPEHIEAFDDAFKSYLLEKAREWTIGFQPVHQLWKDWNAEKMVLSLTDLSSSARSRLKKKIVEIEQTRKKEKKKKEFERRKAKFKNRNKPKTKKKSNLIDSKNDSKTNTSNYNSTPNSLDGKDGMHSKKKMSSEALNSSSLERKKRIKKTVFLRNSLLIRRFMKASFQFGDIEPGTSSLDDILSLPTQHYDFRLRLTEDSEIKNVESGLKVNEEKQENGAWRSHSFHSLRKSFRTRNWEMKKDYEKDNLETSKKIVSDEKTIENEIKAMQAKQSSLERNSTNLAEYSNFLVAKIARGGRHFKQNPPTEI
eukprot:g1878.t1